MFGQKLWKIPLVIFAFVNNQDRCIINVLYQILFLSSKIELTQRKCETIWITCTRCFVIHYHLQLCINIEIHEKSTLIVLYNMKYKIQLKTKEWKRDVRYEKQVSLSKWNLPKYKDKRRNFNCHIQFSCFEKSYFPFTVRFVFVFWVFSAFSVNHIILNISVIHKSKFTF